MRLEAHLEAGEHGTPIEFANAIINSTMCRSLNDLEALVDHLDVEVKRCRREQRDRECQGYPCAQD